MNRDTNKMYGIRNADGHWAWYSESHDTWYWTPWAAYAVWYTTQEAAELDTERIGSGQVITVTVREE